MQACYWAAFGTKPHPKSDSCIIDPVNTAQDKSAKKMRCVNLCESELSVMS